MGLAFRLIPGSSGARITPGLSGGTKQAFVSGSVSYWLWVVNSQAFPDKVGFPWMRVTSREGGQGCWPGKRDLDEGPTACTTDELEGDWRVGEKCMDLC